MAYRSWLLLVKEIGGRPMKASHLPIARCEKDNNKAEQECCSSMVVDRNAQPAQSSTGPQRQTLLVIPAESGRGSNLLRSRLERSAVVPVRISAFRLSAAIRSSMPSFFRIAANSQRRVATSLIAPSR